jgi:hypothetical protein
MQTSSPVSPEVRKAEAERRLQVLLKHPTHPSVANVNASALNYVEAAEYSLSVGCPLLALYQIGVAEGIATALREVAGVASGLKEYAVLTAVLRKVMEIRCRVARKYPESPTKLRESEEVEIPIQ